MKIIELTAENFKKLRAVQIIPDGNIVQITGANEQGKSSVLDAIWAAIDCAGFLKETKTKEPIRQGEKKAVIKLDLGELIITRKFTPSGASVEVTTKDGACYKSPQAILDALIGKISFDPLAFSTMDEKKQKEMLLSLVKIDLDLTAHSAGRQKNYEDRADINRSIKQLEGQLAGIPTVPADTPDEERQSADILNEMRQAQQVKDDNDRKRQELRDLSSSFREKRQGIENLRAEDTKITEQVAELENKIIDLRKGQDEIREIAETAIKELNVVETNGLNLKTIVDALVDPDMSVFDTQMVELETVNMSVRQKKDRAKVLHSLNNEKTKSQALSEMIDALDKQKEDAIKAAAFPVAGLGFDDNGVMYKGVPFAQCSSAERLRVSIAMAMSMNPALRVIRIADGSLLDSKNMAIIEEMAKAHDFQCFIERVDESGTIGIVIEDGSIKIAEADNV